MSPQVSLFFTKRRLSSWTFMGVIGLLAVSALIPLASSRLAQATVAVRATIESLTEQAQLIILARAHAKRTPKERGPQGQIYTQTDLQVLERWKGSSGAQLTVQQLGGSLDGFTLHVSGSPQLEVGRDYVLFLVKSTQEEGLYHVVSLAQGVYQVSAPSLRAVEGSSPPVLARTVSQDLSGITFYQATPPQGPASDKAHLVHSPEPVMTLNLEGLKAQVTASLGGQR